MLKRKKIVARTNFKYDVGRRQKVLTSLSGILSKSPRLLWYLETLVLSSRFFQRVSDVSFGSPVSKKNRFSFREELWLKAVIPYLQSTRKPVHVAEFGVASGLATQWWHLNLKTISAWDGFDTFEGLPEDWSRGGVSVMKKGVFAPQDPTNPFPQVAAGHTIRWHRGLISETIGNLTREPDSTLLILVDVDLLGPTRDIMRWALKNCASGDCIYFDEAFDPFNEGMALQEAIDDELKFHVIGYTGSALAIVVD